MPLLVLLFVVVPIAELFVIIQVGGAIGVLPTIGLLVLDSVLGSVLMRSQGRAAWRSFLAASQAGKVPAREVVDGALVILGGALLLTPGFLTDLLGLLLLIPPTRAFIRRTLLSGLIKRMGARAPSVRGGPRSPFGPPGRRPGDDVVDGTAHDVEPRRLP